MKATVRESARNCGAKAFLRANAHHYCGWLHLHLLSSQHIEHSTIEKLRSAVTLTANHHGLLGVRY
jgi:hypothetical protein